LIHAGCQEAAYANGDQRQIPRPSPAAPLGNASALESSRVESSQVEPNQVEPSQAKSSQVEPSQAKPSQVKSSQVKSSRAKPNQAKPSQVKSSQAKPSRAKPRKVKSSQATSSQVKPSRAKPWHVVSCRVKSCHQLSAAARRASYRRSALSSPTETNLLLSFGSKATPHTIYERLSTIDSSKRRDERSQTRMERSAEHEAKQELLGATPRPSTHDE